MEYTDRKLNTNNPVLVSQIFSRLVQSITAKGSGKNEFNYLKTKCLDKSNLISDAARVSVLKLIGNGTLQFDQVLAEFITSISTASNITALTRIIVCLLNLKISNTALSGTIKRTQYPLLQHPIIKILQVEAHTDVQICIYNEVIHHSCKDPRILQLITVLYEPLYLYCICTPVIKVELSLLREKLWTFLIKYDEDFKTNFISKLCCWIQIHRSNAELAGCLLDQLLQRQVNCKEFTKDLDYLILMQILAIHNMILEHNDCRLCIVTVLSLLPKIQFSHHNLSILILSKALLVCSPLYLEDLLRLCLYFTNHNSCQPYSYFALKVGLLHWLSGPCILTDDALKIVEDIMRLNDYICREKPLILPSRLTINKFHYLIFCNPETFFTLELGIKIENTHESTMCTLVECFKEAPLHFQKNCFTFLCGLMLHPKLSRDNKLKILSVILRCSLYYLEFLPTLFALTLYLLSNSDDNRLHFELLKALPHMAKEKENLPKVVATIQAISKHSIALGTFALKLIYDTWEIDDKCYSALETIVLQSIQTISRHEMLEQNISKAYIFRKLSEKSPELYGKDLVAHLSKILNECTNADGSIPSSLAIEGIRHLCKAEVIDIVTTWATLAPKFKNDTRVPVIKSLCGLISELPNLEYAQAFEKLHDEVIEYLWDKIINSYDEEVIGSAFDSLALFNLDLICLHIPEMYLDENSVKRNPVGDHRIVSGKTWLKFLSSHRSKDAARTFLTKLVANEIDNYLKYVYQLKSQREPDNFGTLPTHSIVRALGEFIQHNFIKVKSWENTPNEDLFLNCLKILSLKYSKPLPPLDWCFLQELVHIPKMKACCLDLASHQAVLSGSARRLMENYIIAATENPLLQTSNHVYRNLKHLANSIQPMILKPFLQNSLHSVLQVVDKEPVFEEFLRYLDEILINKDIQDVNKNVIEEVLSEIIFIIDTSCKVFSSLLKCASSFSSKGQEKIAKFNLDKLSPTEFSKIAKIRCHISKTAKSEKPLNWLNGIFESAYRMNMPLDLYIDDISYALKRNLNHEDSPLWLNELFGAIQAKVADRCDLAEIGYFCDILAFAVVHFSGFFVMLPKNDYSSIKYFFPAALTFLLDEPTWSFCTAQILEWLHHMNMSESIPDEFKHIFGWALASLRHQEDFCKSSRWMKYLDCEIYTKNVS